MGQDQICQLGWQGNLAPPPYIRLHYNFASFYCFAFIAASITIMHIVYFTSFMQARHFTIPSVYEDKLIDIEIYDYSKR